MLCSILRTRRLSVSISDFCAQADITRPTFAAHCDSVTDALQRYEQALLEAYEQHLGLWHQDGIADHEIMFISLLSFIHQHREYFLATIPNHNYTLTYKLLDLTLSPNFPTSDSTVSADVTPVSTHEILLHHQLALISSWAERYQFAKPQLAIYAKLMINEECRVLQSS